MSQRLHNEGWWIYAFAVRKFVSYYVIYGPPSEPKVLFATIILYGFLYSWPTTSFVVLSAGNFSSLSFIMMCMYVRSLLKFVKSKGYGVPMGIGNMLIHSQ